MRDVLLGAEAPPAAGILEREITAVAIRHVLEGQPWKQPPHALVVHRGEPVLQPFLHVGVHDVPQVAVGHENILPAVEIDVHEHRAPRPTTGLHPRRLRDLREGAIAAIEEERVALKLQRQLLLTGLFGERRVRGYLRLEAARIVGQHVRLEEIGTPVTVHVGHIDTHGRIARLSLRAPIGQTEVAPPVVDPQLIGILEVVGHVQVGGPIAVEIDELRREAERFEFFGQRHARSVEKPPARHRHACEPAGPVVDVELVGFGALRHAHATHVGTHHQLVVAPVLRNDFVLSGRHLPHHLVERMLLRWNRVVHVVWLVVRDEQREPATAVHIGQGHGGRATSGRVETEVSPLGEMRVSVVEQHSVGTGGRQQHEVEVIIAVEVGHGGAGDVPVAGADAGRARDVLEREVADVAIQGAASLGAGQKDIRTSVTVDIPEGDPAALAEHAVSQQDFFTRRVLKTDPRLSRSDAGEAVGSAGDGQCTPAMIGRVVPHRVVARGAGGEREAGGDGQSVPAHHRVPTHGRENSMPTRPPMQRPSARPPAFPDGKWTPA